MIEQRRTPDNVSKEPTELNLNGLSVCSIDELLLNNHSPSRMAVNMFNNAYRSTQKMLENVFHRLKTDYEDLMGNNTSGRTERANPLGGRRLSTSNIKIQPLESGRTAPRQRTQSLRPSSSVATELNMPQLLEGQEIRRLASPIRASISQGSSVGPSPRILSSSPRLTSEGQRLSAAARVPPAEAFNFAGYKNSMEKIANQLESYKRLELSLLHNITEKFQLIQQLSTVERPNIVHSYRLIAEYLLRRGYFDAAKKLIETMGLSKEFSLEGYEVLTNIKDSLNNAQIHHFLDWAKTNDTKLKEFNGKLQNYVHLLKAFDQISVASSLTGQTPSQYNQIVRNAIRYIQTNINTSTFENDFSANDDLTNVMRMFAIPPELWHLPHIDPNKCGLSWAQLSAEFIRYYFHAHQIGVRDPFETTLEAGMLVTKSTSCCCTHSEHPKCPTCCPLLNKIANDLPLPSRENSLIICRLTNDLIDEQNPGLMLPNGQVYGTRGIRLNANQDGTFTCPITNYTCRVNEDMQRVFIV